MENSKVVSTVSPGDGLVTVDRLKKLLSIREEHDDLDFKEEWDPKGIHLNKFVKTMAAMSSMDKGGYVVVGVDDDKNAVGIEEPNAKNFDPAVLGDIYRRYTGNSGIRSALHCIDEKYFGIIYVPKSPESFSVIIKDSPQNRGSDSFKAGDVFLREDTSNTKLSKISANRIVEKIRREEREQTTRMFFENISQWQAPELPISISEFISISSESQFKVLSERKDYSELANLGMNISNLIFDSDKSFDPVKVRNSLSSVFSFLLDKDENSFKLLLSHISRKYNSELGTSDYPGHRSARIALEIIIVVEALGAFAIRRRKFRLAKELAIVSVHIKTHNYTYVSWLRHGQVMASREGVTKSVKPGMPVGSILIGKAFEEIRDVQALRPEAQSDLDYEMIKEYLLWSVVSFDFLWCMIVLESGGRERDYYPGWVFFPPKSISWFVMDITSDYSIRELIFTDPSIGKLQELLTKILANPEKYVDYRDLEDDYDTSIIMDAYHGGSNKRGAREAL